MTIQQAKTKINEMSKLDQKLRNAQELDWDLIDKIDSTHTKELKKIIKFHGLISISKFGKQTSNDAWLLVQHSPDYSFMEEYLQLMEDKTNDIDAKNLAYLRDRVNSHNGIPQVYGTQVYRGKDTNDKWIFRPIIDITNIDLKRKSVGLNTLKEYAKEFIEDGIELELPKGYMDSQKKSGFNPTLSICTPPSSNHHTY
jgi:hypothetical protein